MDINLLRDNLRQIDTTNIIHLISDVLLHNIDKIDNFRSDMMYYQDDIVYMFDESTGRHKLYRCTVNKIDPGAFNPTQWDEYVFRFDDRAIYLESTFTATSDNTFTCNINQPLYDYVKDTLNVYHSIRGRLRKGIDWELNTNKTAIILRNFSLFKNEFLIFEVIK